MDKYSNMYKNSVTNSNNVNYCYGTEKEIKKDININEKISKVFKNTKHFYKIDAIIKLKDKTVNKKIIAKTSDYLLTIDNEKILISDIIDIENQ